MNQPKQTNSVSFIPLSGVGDVTRNMYVYEYNDEILLVDCGLGFANETMVGVDLLIPDISYLLKADKKIVGLLLTHGHEDHIGALPFILPQLPGNFPIYGSPLTAAFANEKLKEFELPERVEAVPFASGDIRLGSFSVSFVRITHSIPDTTNIFIRTPAGNLYHGSDFKFDFTPADGKRTDIAKIASFAKEGIMCLMCDSLGSEREGFSPSEEALSKSFRQIMESAKAKVFITTYSSNISRLNQAIEAAESYGKKICFVGRSLVKAKMIGQRMGYLRMKEGTEIEMDELQNFPSNKLVLFVAGSQGQENSALTRIASGEHREVHLREHDVVIFSSDAIPGNEISVNSLIDTISKRGATPVYSEISENFHVSGHGSEGDHKLMLSLTNPRFIIPISGTYRHMVALKDLSEKMGYSPKQNLLLENGQEVVFSDNQAKLGRKIQIRNVYVDEISGEEVEHYVLRDRERLAHEGIVVIMTQIAQANGALVGLPEVIARGFSSKDFEMLQKLMERELKYLFGDKKTQVTNWMHIRKQIENTANSLIYKKLHRRPLVLPVIIEV